MASPSLDFSSFSNVINGELKGTEKTRHSINPSTLEANLEVPISTTDDVDLAVSVAQKAGAAWAKVPLAERKEAVEKFAAALAEEIAGFATTLVKEQGKPIGMGQLEIVEAVKILKGIAELDFVDETTELTQGRLIKYRHVPIGVVVGIVPWNFPIYLATFKIAPALIAGNAFILKPSPFTPYGGLKLAELGLRFFPPGVFQALSGDDNLGPWLTAHPGVGKVSFTGSVATGKRVLQSCSSNLKRVTLELGGNDPAIVCDDVKLEEVIPKIAVFTLLNTGQVCIAIKRLYVHEKIYDQFLAALVQAVEQLPIGDGFEEGKFLGPIQNSLQYDRVQSFLKNIKESNLTIATKIPEENATASKGYFISPVIVDNPPDDSEIVTGEPFGPVFPVLKWTDEDDVIRRANDSEVGLGASVWTNDLERAERIGKQLQAGTVWVNAHQEIFPNVPFGGHKESGLGAELGVDGIKANCNLQVLHLGRSE